MRKWTDESKKYDGPLTALNLNGNGINEETKKWNTSRRGNYNNIMDRWEYSRWRNSTGGWDIEKLQYIDYIRYELWF